MPHSSLPRLLATTALCLLPFAGAQADTVWLKNGDRLTGTIESLDGGKLLLKTAYGGGIKIDFAQVKTLQSDTDLVISDESLDHDYRAKLVAADAGSVTLNGIERGEETNRPVNDQVKLASVNRVVRPRPFLNEATFKGRVDLSANQKFASTNTKDYTLQLNTELRDGRWRQRFGADYTRSQENDTVSTYNYGGGYTLDYFMSKRAFWQGRLAYRRDFVEDLSRQITVGTGPGYQFWDNALGAFSMSALVNRVNYQYKTDETENAFAAGLGWDYVRYFSGKDVELYTRGEVLRSFNSKTNYTIDGEIGTRYNLNSMISLYLKYARHQVTGSAEGVNQSIYSTGLGVKW